MNRPVPRPAGTLSCATRSGRTPGRGVATALLAIVAAATLGTAVVGCGKKGDPLPPIRQIPAATKDLQAIQRGDRLLLSLPFPRTTAAGTPLSAVTEVTVWSLRWDAPATTDGSPPQIDVRQFLATARPERTLSGKDLQSAVSGDRVELELPMPSGPTEPSGAAAMAATAATTATSETSTTEAGTPAEPEKAPATPTPSTTSPTPVVTLAVKSQGPTGEESGLSNLVTFAVAPAPEAPTGLKLEGEDRGVRLRWEYPETEEEAAQSEPEAATEGQPTGSSAAPDGMTTTTASGAAADADANGDASAMAAPKAGESDEASAEDDDSASSGGLLGFNIYRRLATEREYGAPVRTVGRKARTVVDDGARFGQRYLYAVTAVSQRQPVLVESRLGEEVEIDYKDRFAPSAPTGVVALVQEGEGGAEAHAGAVQVRVVWRPVADKDLAGYRVYRRSPASQEFQRITDALVTDTAVIDHDVTAGASYTYRVSAVDRDGNESDPSDQVTARVR